MDFPPMLIRLAQGLNNVPQRILIRLRQPYRCTYKEALVGQSIGPTSRGPKFPSLAVGTPGVHWPPARLLRRAAHHCIRLGAPGPTRVSPGAGPATVTALRRRLSGALARARPAANAAHSFKFQPRHSTKPCPGQVAAESYTEGSKLSNVQLKS